MRKIKTDIKSVIVNLSKIFDLLIIVWACIFAISELMLLILNQFNITKVIAEINKSSNATSNIMPRMIFIFCFGTYIFITLNLISATKSNQKAMLKEALKHQITEDVAIKALKDDNIDFETGIKLETMKIQKQLGLPKHLIITTDATKGTATGWINRDTYILNFNPLDFYTDKTAKAILWHEFGHIKYQHSAKTMRFQLILISVYIIATILLITSSTCFNVLQPLFFILIDKNLFDSIYNKHKEKQADLFSAKYNHAMDLYNAFAADLQYGETKLEAFESNHPAHKTRMRYLLKYAMKTTGKSASELLSESKMDRDEAKIKCQNNMLIFDDDDSCVKSNN